MTRRAEQARKILLAPVPITPTKPLTPSHLRGMLWVDVMKKATGELAEVDCLYSHLTANASEQTVGFWEYVDRVVGDVDFQDHSEETIGQLYVRYHQQAEKASVSALSPYLSAVEKHSWVHPISARLYGIWSEHATLLRMQDPGADRQCWPAVSTEELVRHLVNLNLCIDLRSRGGAAYLDLTSEGMALRKVITAEGKANYLIHLLRELVPQIGSYHHMVLIHDLELHADYTLLKRILMRLGASVDRVAISRVAINGVVQSARHGSWHGHTASDLIREFAPDADEDCFRLGMRLYFISGLGKGRAQSFDPVLLRRAILRARHLIASAKSRKTEESVDEFLNRCSGKNQYVDPYKVAAGLLSRNRIAPFPSEGLPRWFV
jgi:hypothetical protein